MLLEDVNDLVDMVGASRGLKPAHEWVPEVAAMLANEIACRANEGLL